MTSVNRVLTQYYPNQINTDYGTLLYEHLKLNIEWEDGVKSQNGFTRKEKSISPGDDRYFDTVIKTLNMSDVMVYILIIIEMGMITPNHSHPGMKQLIISLGRTRTLTMGKKSYK